MTAQPVIVELFCAPDLMEQAIRAVGLPTAFQGVILIAALVISTAYFGSFSLLSLELQSVVS